MNKINQEVGICFDLVEAKEKELLEQPYQERIEAAFRALG